MDTKAVQEFVDRHCDESAIPSLVDFIAIPNQSPLFDPEWNTNGLLDQACEHVSNWAKAQNLKGFTLERHQNEGKPPLIFIEIEGTRPDAETVFMYGHFDKQPPLLPWSEGKGPYSPVIEESKLWGRGGVDDGYSIYAGLTAVKALQNFDLPHDRIVFFMEGEEESGSPNLDEYIAQLRDKIGDPALIICLDAGSGDYETFWNDASLRGMCALSLDISLMKTPMHSGEGSGVVASSFRVLRQLLDRLEDSRSGRMLLPELFCPITPEIYQQCAQTISYLGEDKLMSKYSKHDQVDFVDQNTVENYLNVNYRPTLCITGCEGIPDLANAGNVLRTNTKVLLSIRLPPGVDPMVAAKAVQKEVTRDPPYNAIINAEIRNTGSGYAAPTMEPWLKAAYEGASQEFFGKEPQTLHMGGSIPLMHQLRSLFPNAQFLVTGILGPGSNAHCPDESMDLPYFKKFIGAISYVVHKHATK